MITTRSSTLRKYVYCSAIALCVVGCVSIEAEGEKAPLLAFSSSEDGVPDGETISSMTGRLWEGVATENAPGTASATDAAATIDRTEDTFHIVGPAGRAASSRSFILKNSGMAEPKRRLPAAVHENYACLDLTQLGAGPDVIPRGGGDTLFGEEPYFAFFPGRNEFSSNLFDTKAVSYVILFAADPAIRTRFKFAVASHDNSLTRGDVRDGFEGHPDKDVLTIDIRHSTAYVWKHGDPAEIFATDSEVRPPRAIPFVTRASTLSVDQNLRLQSISLVLEGNQCKLKFNGSEEVLLPNDRCRIPGQDGFVDRFGSVPSLTVLATASSRPVRNAANGFCIVSVNAQGIYMPAE